MRGKFWLPLAFLLALCVCGERAVETPPPATLWPSRTPPAASTSRPELFPEPTAGRSIETELPQEEDGRLALRAGEGKELPAELLLAPVELGEVLQGTLTGYARLRADGWIFEWLESDYSDRTPEMSYQEEKVLISREGGQDCQSFEMWDYSMPDVGPEEKLLYEDVDFDGLPDLLACTGHHGNQGFVTFYCYLQRDGGFEECPSYTDIWFPSIDTENKRILSFQRNWAASHSWGIYEFQDGEFVSTHWLTEEPAPDWLPSKENDYENMVWQWTVDGQVIGRSDTLTEEEIDQLFAYFGCG